MSVSLYNFSNQINTCLDSITFIHSCTCIYVNFVGFGGCIRDITSGIYSRFMFVPLEMHCGATEHLCFQKGQHIPQGKGTSMELWGLVQRLRSGP